MIVHAVGVAGAGVGTVWLLLEHACCLPKAELLSVCLYMVTLAGTLLSSTLYNFLPPGRRKEVLRRIDHAMIYALIAGTYTPFAVHHIIRTQGNAHGLGIVWGVALAGIGLKVVFPRRLERLGFALYLGLGWAVAVLAPSVWSSLTIPTLALVLAGGVLYTVGSMIHLMTTVAYHNAAWHVLVVAAAGCHFVAVALVSTS